MVPTPLFSSIAMVVVSLGSGPARAELDLRGTWEIQTMGGDREVEIRQQGNKVIIHRIMWPEFEGERYKLEHLYRGKLTGSALKGQLLVKEDELPEFEVLRDFTGSVASAERITIDGLPLKRLGAAPAAAEPASPPPKVEERPTDIPEVAQTNAPAAPATPSEPGEPGANLFATILGGPGAGDLFKVSSTITIPDRAAALTSEGDALFTAGEYAGALANFEAAARESGGQNVQLLHRRGRCLTKLGRAGEAKAMLRQALKLDPANQAIRRDYDAVKPSS